MKVSAMLLLLGLMCAAPDGRANALLSAQATIAAAQEKIRHGEGRAALELLLPLARQGEPEAAYWLGRLYYYDIPGVPRSWPQAFRWFSKAARQGHPAAQYKLGGMYFTGRGVTKNLCKSIHWWHLAALHRQSEALNNLGALLATGQGLKRDPALGLALQILAAELGSEAAAENVFNKQTVNADYFAAAQKLASNFSHPEKLAEALKKTTTCRR